MTTIAVKGSAATPTRDRQAGWLTGIAERATAPPCIGRLGGDRVQSPPKVARRRSADDGPDCRRKVAMPIPSPAAMVAASLGANHQIKRRPAAMLAIGKTAAMWVQALTCHRARGPKERKGVLRSRPRCEDEQYSTGQDGNGWIDGIPTDRQVPEKTEEGENDS